MFRSRNSSSNPLRRGGSDHRRYGYSPSSVALFLRLAFGVLLLVARQQLVCAQTGEVPGVSRVNSISTLRSLQRRLKSDDPAIRESARFALESLGYTQQELDRDLSLDDSDPGRRAEFVKSLNSKQVNQWPDLLLLFSRDDDRRVRTAVLDALRKANSLPQFVNRVRELSQSDHDPTVRGFARLLAADWSEEAGVSVEETPVSTNDIGIATLSFEEEADAGIPAPPGFEPVVPYWVKPSSPQDPAKEAAFTTHVHAGAPATINIFANEAEDVATLSLNPFQKDDGRLDNGQGQETVTLRVLDWNELEQPFDTGVTDAVPPLADGSGPFLQTQEYATLGFAGPSGIKPAEIQRSDHFAPAEDRWRTGFPEWDRYGNDHPIGDDYLYAEGHWWDPYNQNVLKGDYPIVGQHTFLNITATSLSIYEWRQVPTGTTPFESTFNPFSERFFGNPRQDAARQLFKLRAELFHGNEAFKPADWRVRIEPVFNLNYLKAKELSVVNPDVRKGKRRGRDDFALEEWFVEKKLADLGPEYDFVSVRAGSQLFVSDFRGFVFSDINRAVRLFGTRRSNRDQFNLIWFDQTEKETNSELNTFDDRHQNTLIANYFRQDFIFPGYTAQFSMIYNVDEASFKFDENDFLVRPDPAGVARPHKVESVYFGLNGDGHIGRFNLSNSFYVVTGRDDLNPIAGKKQSIRGRMGAVELSYDRDYVRFRTSWFWASGDDDVFDGKARGFDTVLDNPNFAGGLFSYWQRNAVRLFGVNLVQRESLVPNLRSSKIQGQSNFVNPGLNLVNAGMDIEITPKLKLISNANYMWFDSTHVLEIFTFQDKIDPEIGTDLSVGLEYRPFLNDNVIFIAGFSTFIPGKGFNDLFGIANPLELFEPKKIQAEQMYSNFIELVMTY